MTVDQTPDNPASANLDAQHQPLDHHGGAKPRGQATVPHSSTLLGKFGRMFRELQPLRLTDDQLGALAERMKEDTAAGGWSGTPVPGDNPELVAGFTYLAQFVDHDITFDPVSVIGAVNDPDALENFRTPRYDLDCLYGSGPKASPHLYDQDDPDLLLVGANPDGTGFEPRDLPRNQQGRALIGDPRNDVQVIISQLHLAMIDFHNATVRRVRATPDLANTVGGALVSGGGVTPYGQTTPATGTLTVFDVASTLVRWHYQWIVMFELLPALVGAEVVGQVLPEPKHGRREAKLKLYDPRRGSYMPVEFSGGAYRFGHTLVRDAYVLNSHLPPLPVFSPADNPGLTDDLRGFRPLPSGWTIEWEHFFAGVGADPALVQRARAMDTRISASMSHLSARVDTQRRSIALLNLQRGQALGLPSGEDVAAAVSSRVGLGELAPVDTGLPHPAPLWFWLLREAEVRGQNIRLGPVGGRIVAEVLVGLAARDRSSWLRSKPDFTPVLGQTPGVFTMADLLRAAQTERG